MKDPFFSRVRVLYGLVFLLALFLIAKLVLVQVIGGEAFSEKAKRQYISSISAPFDRGSIFFQTKDEIPHFAAILKTGFIVAIIPSTLGDTREVFEKIRLFLPDLDEQSFFLKAGKKDDPYEEIARKIPEELARNIEGLQIPGVNIYREKWRFYPGGSLAAHVLGFVGFKDDDLGGRYGVERYYDDILRRNEKELYVNFFAEVFANIEYSLFYNGKREGDIVLSIDPEVERVLERTLRETVARWNADSGGAIVINPQTGSIYGLAVEPTFDPNYFSEEEDFNVFSNPLVESVFEMGSIMKPITMAAGLDAGVINSQTTYNDKGAVSFDGFEIKNYDGEARGIVSMQEVLNQSLNTGAVFVMQKLGKENFAKYFLNFGFGEETGVDLPNEVSGLVQNLKSTHDIEYATASFGQGIAVTPIAMVRALSTLANGGFLITPHVVGRVEYKFNSSLTDLEDTKKQILKDGVAEEITRMLVRVVDDALLGGTVKLEDWSVAAKTGTAQIALPGGGGYYEDKFLHSFFGYFPAYDPKFLTFFYIVNPRGVRYASQTLTNPFMDMTKFLLNYYEIPPDR